MRETVTIRVRVNGTDYERVVESRLLLSDFLRDSVGLTGTHVGCEHGICGCCTVMVDGLTVRSCLMFAIQVDGADVMTVEGLADGGKLHPLQEAFSENHGLQCGFCTPGMLFSALELLNENPRPTEREIREGISGTICRCTGYYHIVESVKAAAQKLAQKEK